MTVDPQTVRSRLEAERARVEALRRELQGRLDLLDPDDSPAVTEQDPADTAIDTIERQKDEAILEQLDGELAEIDAARQRLADGTYGFDEVTGDPIDPARLEARPTARTNVNTRPDDRRDRSRPPVESARRS